jgi:hypothetical protein
MKKSILGAIAAAAVVAPIAISAPANAAPGPNHGQCVSSAVKAGVEGDAFKAIATNNALVGQYGSATCPAPTVVVPAQDKAEGKVTWKVTDATDATYTTLTGTTTFNADVNGGSIAYTAHDNNGVDYVMNGVVTPGSYKKIDAHTAVFSGTISAGSSDVYTRYNPYGAFFTAKVVDGGAPQDGQGDVIAVLNNQVVPGTFITSTTDDAARAATIAYPMGVGTAGFVVTGNLTIG